MIVDIRADQSRADATRAQSAVEAPVEPFAEISGFDGDDAIDIEPAGIRWVAPTLALLLCAVWIFGLGWLAWRARPTMIPSDYLVLASAMAAVPTLIGIAWLLLLRTSQAESRRFGHAAEAMRAEAAALERSVAAVTRTLDANRAELTEQMSLLTSLGEATSERLATIGHGIKAEIAAADNHAARLGQAAADAQASVGVLLASLPHARSDTEELTHALTASGDVALRHVETLGTQLVALAEHGRDAETVTGKAAATLAARVTEIERSSDSAALRLESAAGATAATVDTLLGRTADAVDAARRGIDGQAEAMSAMMSAHQTRLDGAARDSAAALAERIESVDTAVERLAGRLEQQRVAGDGMIADMEGGIDRVVGRMDALHEQGIGQSQLLAASISALGGSADAMTQALRAGEAMATKTIGTTETLLIALDAAAREIDETLPDALARLDQRIGQSKAVVVQAKPELLALVTAAESTHDAIEAIATVIADQRRTLDQLSSNLLDTLTSGRAKADALGKMVDETIGRSHRFAEEAAPRLVEALLRVRDTAAAAADHARETLADVIPEAAGAIRDAAGAAMRSVAADTVHRQIDAIADATDAAVSAATRATERLAAQVREISEQTAIVESRIEDARGEREAADKDTLSRRVSLLIESINSASIDITKAFAPDISDSAWAAYLKGDRGVFTRRAVRILDAGDAREVVRLYDDEPNFREQVNRYIHDFESMLRAVLTQRDGSPLGVTLLSSDMGKLYVALAQAIERLR